MTKVLAIALAAALLFGSVGCANKTTGGPPPPPPTNTLQSEARDVAAALKGVCWTHCAPTASPPSPASTHRKPV